LAQTAPRDLGQRPLSGLLVLVVGLASAEHTSLSPPGLMAKYGAGAGRVNRRVMKTGLLQESPTHLTVVVMSAGDEWSSDFTNWADKSALRASSFTGIGGFSSALLGYYDVDQQKYMDIPVEEQVEVLSLTGDITLDGEHRLVHAHVVCGRRDGSVVGGHLQRGVVCPTLEIMLTETPSFLKRTFEPKVGLPLIDL
jgi:uncharacterized protein